MHFSSNGFCVDAIYCCLEIVITPAMQPWVVAMALATLMCFTSTCYFFQTLSRMWNIHIRDSLLISLQISLHAAVLSTRCPTIHVRYSDVILESWVFLRLDPIDWVACHAKLACHVTLRIPEEIRKKESSQAAALGIWGPPDAEFNWCEEAPFAEGQWQCLQAVRCAGWTEAKLSGPIEPQYHHRFLVKACNYI